MQPFPCTTIRAKTTALLTCFTLGTILLEGTQEASAQYRPRVPTRVTGSHPTLLNQSKAPTRRGRLELEVEQLKSQKDIENKQSECNTILGLLGLNSAPKSEESLLHFIRTHDSSEVISAMISISDKKKKEDVFIELFVKKENREKYKAKLKRISLRVFNFLQQCI